MCRTSRCPELQSIHQRKTWKRSPRWQHSLRVFVCFHAWECRSALVRCRVGDLHSTCVAEMLFQGRGSWSSFHTRRKVCAPVTRLAFLSNIQHRHHFCGTCSEGVWLGLNKRRAQLLSGTSVRLSDETAAHLGIIQHTRADTSHSTAGLCALGIRHTPNVWLPRKVLKLNWVEVDGKALN